MFCVIEFEKLRNIVGEIDSKNFAENMKMVLLLLFSFVEVLIAKILSNFAQSRYLRSYFCTSIEDRKYYLFIECN